MIIITIIMIIITVSFFICINLTTFVETFLFYFIPYVAFSVRPFCRLAFSSFLSSSINSVKACCWSCSRGKAEKRGSLRCRNLNSGNLEKGFSLALTRSSRKTPLAAIFFAAASCRSRSALLCKNSSNTSLRSFLDNK